MNPKYIDIHSHVQFSAFNKDRDDVLRRAREAETWMINVGTEFDTSKKAVELANKAGDGVFATVGLHPTHTIDEEFNYDAYKILVMDPKVIAIGECGLDYYRLEKNTVEKQKKVFEQHVRLADEVGKPLMLHIRNFPEGSGNAYKDVLEILRGINPKIRGDVHFFAGSQDDARAFLDFGFTLSFTGAITFLKSKKPGMADYEELIKFIPLDMIMAETDCPYLSPVPLRGKRNEPANVRHVVAKIAEIKGLSEDKVAPILVANTKRVFGI